MRKLTQILVPILVLGLLSGTMVIMLTMILASAPPEAEGSCNGSISSGCTVFTVSKDDQVFFGGNDDYINPDSYYWVDPGYGED